MRRYGATIAYGLFDHVTLLIEYLHAETKMAVDNSEEAVTVQLALEY